MMIVAWLVLGFAFGAVASQAATRTNLGVVGNVALAIAGAMLAGVLADYCAGGIEATRGQLGSAFGSMAVVVIIRAMHDEHERRHAQRVGPPF